MQALVHELRDGTGSSSGLAESSPYLVVKREKAAGYPCSSGRRVVAVRLAFCERHRRIFTPLRSIWNATKSFWRLAAWLVAAGALVAATAVSTKAVLELHSKQPFLRQACDVSDGATHRHQVKSGDTLWGIAEHYYDDVDPREAVSAIRACNELSTAEIAPGQVLRLPRLGSSSVPQSVLGSYDSADRQ